MIYKFLVLTLGISLILYTLLGGADFGAGVIALFSRTRTRSVIFDAMAPVWEANHVWLILVIVILFTGFPRIYATISRFLHLPLLFALIGIVLRGSTFAFQHYDVNGDETRLYSWTFYVSSLLTPVFLGIVLGSTMSGMIDPSARSFYTRYVASWLGWFPFSMGLFSLVLFAYVASVFLTGETDDPQTRNEFIGKTRWSLLLSVIGGGVVFTVAWLENIPLLTAYFQSYLSLACIALATLLIPILFYSINHKWTQFSRMVVGAQVTCILVGWFSARYPLVVQFRGDEPITLDEALAPQATVNSLAVALVVGSLLVIPAMIYLFSVFKVWEDSRP